MHLQANGFDVTERDTGAIDAEKDRLGVPPSLRSCHTAEVEGYVLEGHVPGDVVHRLLRERPADVAGLAVPGMPVGSPGMEVPGRGPDRYNVMAWGGEAGTRVYASR